jgi:hypothetical protein
VRTRTRMPGFQSIQAAAAAVRCAPHANDKTNKSGSHSLDK